MNIDCTPPMFVNFEVATGEIYSVGPSKQDGYDSIEVDFASVERILNFTDKKTDYKVVFNTVDKQFELKHQSEVQQTYQGFIAISDDVENADVELLRNGNEMKIIVSSKVQEVFDKTNLDSTTSFSICAKDDPHTLYDLLKVDLRKNNSFLLDLNKDFTIYTKRKFATYNYKDLT